jgi:hypothetical protein
MGYRRGRRVGERGGKREGLRMERNSSRASEGKVDLMRQRFSESGKGGTGKEAQTWGTRGERTLEIRNQDLSE